MRNRSAGLLRLICVSLGTLFFVLWVFDNMCFGERPRFVWLLPVAALLLLANYWAKSKRS
jgi:hypothetical protein